MSKRARTGSYSMLSTVTQEESTSANVGVSRYSGGYAYKRTGYKKKPKRSYRGVSYYDVTRAIRVANWKSRETKMLNVYLDEINLSTIVAGDVRPFPTPALGTAANQRMGNKIDGVGMKLSVIFNNNASTPVYIRLLILKVRQGDVFNDTAVLQNLLDLSSPGTSPETSGGPTGRLSDLNRQINRNEFTVIRDKLICMDGDGQDTGVASEVIYFRTPGRVTYGDSDWLQPISPRYVFVTMCRQANSDENLGSTVEMTYAATNYFKDV